MADQKVANAPLGSFLTRATSDLNGAQVQHILPAIPKGCDVTLGYTGSDLTTVTYTCGADTWAYTLTYDAGNLVGISCS